MYEVKYFYAGRYSFDIICAFKKIVKAIFKIVWETVLDE